MKFKKVNTDYLTANINNFLIEHYYGKFTEIKKFILLGLSEKRFKEIKNKPISKKEVRELVKKFSVSKTSKRINQIKLLWNHNEKQILEKIAKITNINISTRGLICYIDPYTNLGFYNDKSITIISNMNDSDLLFIISHELFHIFYGRKMKKMKLNEKSWSWDLSEVVVYLLQKDRVFDKYWDNRKTKLYPQIKKVYGKVKVFWSLPFEKFLINSAKVLGNK